MQPMKNNNRQACIDLVKRNISPQYLVTVPTRSLMQTERTEIPYNTAPKIRHVDASSMVCVVMVMPKTRSGPADRTASRIRAGIESASATGRTTRDDP